MPHNLYLHSSIAQARKFDRNDDAEKAKAIRFTTWDSNIQLTVAFCRKLFVVNFRRSIIFMEPTVN